MHIGATAAALVEHTGHSYQELMTMRYEEFLILNLDVREHLNREKQAIDEMKQRQGV